MKFGQNNNPTRLFGPTRLIGTCEYPIINFSILTTGISCWNPAFDVTPADLITGGIITEKGVVKAPLDSLENLKTLELTLPANF